MGSISTTDFQEYSVWEKDVCSKDVLYHLNYTFSNLDRSKKWAIIIDVSFFFFYIVLACNMAPEDRNFEEFWKYRNDIHSRTVLPIPSNIIFFSNFFSPSKQIGPI